MRPSLIILLMSFAILTGCETLMAPDPAAQARQAQQRENYFANLRGECHTYGFQSGTSEMANCVQRLDMQKKQARQLRGHCNLLRSAAMSEPTRSGSTGESFAKGNAAYNKCMAGQQ